MSTTSDATRPGPDAAPPSTAEATRGLRLLDRRALLASAGAAVVGGTVGWLSRGGHDDAAVVGTPGDGPEATTGTPNAISGADARPGMTWPTIPPRHTQLVVLDAAGLPDARLIELVAALPALASPERVDADAGEATLLTGVGLARARSLWPARATEDDLPVFANDAPTIERGGDLAIMASAETAVAARDLAAAALREIGDAPIRWQQSGYRDAPTPRGTARTTTGFIDGIANPRDAEELAAGVWAAPDTHDAYLVVRRMRIRESFTAQPIAAQEQAIGRRRADGAPLSGGGPESDVDLFAKAPDGHQLTPRNAHARRAHPSNIGRGLMLRRSYSFDVDTGAGLLFTAFMGAPSTFTATQRRLDEADDLIAHTFTDAGGCFFVPEEATAPR